MTGAVLAVCPSWAAPDGSAADLAAAHRERVRGLSELLAGAGGRVVGSDGEMVLATVPDAAAAVLGALDVAGREPGTCVAVGWGVIGPDTAPHDVDASRARRLAWRAPPGVRCTAALRAALGHVPPGVGLFRVPHELEHRLGFAAFELSDHRG